MLCLVCQQASDQEICQGCFTDDKLDPYQDGLMRLRRATKELIKQAEKDIERVNKIMGIFPLNP